MAIKGDLQDMSLVDIIQLSCRNEEASIVSLRRDGQDGALYFEDGQVIHATCDQEQGEEAFYQLLKWQEARFTIEKEVEAPERTIHTPWRPLLLQSLQRIDEEDGQRAQEVDQSDGEGSLHELADKLDHVVALFIIDNEGEVVESLLDDSDFDARSAAMALSDTVAQVRAALDAARGGALREIIDLTTEYRFITRPSGDDNSTVHVVLNSEGHIGSARMHLAAYLLTREDEDLR